ncbi:MAG: NAD(P)/FAD-dependent oxidoreductase, partial [Gracilibacteraceae bacterium]|nr:NAD(P)/FAD-dependent oxidoreductase [Gracilibacteraceae bacterium]
HEELSGPEYAERFIKTVRDLPVDVWLDTMVLRLCADKTIYCVSKKHGYQQIEAGAVILSMGCRERSRGAIRTPGDRPAGIFTAGTAQRYVNLEGYMVGKRIVILGSGDIGLIMARRLTLEGAKVLACIEIMPYSNGLTRNIVQCLDDFGIPLYLSHTITQICGKQRVERVVVSKVDENRRPVPGSELEFDCDTVLLSVGLIPENELSLGAGIEIDSRTNGPVVFENYETSVSGIFAAGNVLHVHDVVDNVSREGHNAGKAAAVHVKQYAAGRQDALLIQNGEGVASVVPQKIRAEQFGKGVSFFLRSTKVSRDAAIEVLSGSELLCSFKREVVVPSEMERITIPAAALCRAKTKQIEIRLNGGECA